jgi:ATP-binding cassette subfamily B (MDR/TAP) protein 1
MVTWFIVHALKVVSFNGEKQAITTYNKFIRKAYELALQEGVVNGLASGFLDAALCCSYGLAIWYGSGLIVNHGYNGGMVVSVIMAVMMGAM